MKNAHTIDWRCGEIWFLKSGYHWVDPKWDFRLCYVYGSKSELERRLAQVKKGNP